MHAITRRLAAVLSAGLALAACVFGTTATGSNLVEAQSASATPTPCSTVHLALSNPQSGDLLFPGDYVMQGSAFDSATAAPGVDRVQAYWDRSREDGGRSLGEVTASGPNDPVERLDANGFVLLTHIPDSSGEVNTHVVYVYARSAVSGAEQVLTTSVQLKKPLSVAAFTPTPTPVPTLVSQRPCGSPTPTPTFPPFPRTVASDATSQQTVPAAGVPVGPAADTAPAPNPAPDMGAATPTPLAPATPTATATPAGTLTLRVGNPQAGDSISRGMYVIQGVAFDSRAVGTAGVSRVQVFLDPRDAGGQFLGNADLSVSAAGGPFGFQLTTKLPDRSGGHMLAIYAHSAVADEEIGVLIPIELT
jgi:hypothetical protein